MMRSRMAMGITVVAAVSAGAVGGALIGVPGLSAASQPFPGSASTLAATGSPSTATAPAPGRRGDSALLDAAAKALNLTTKQLTDKLSDGKTTIADVAKQQNVDINTVIAAMAAADKTRLGDIVNRPWPKFGVHGGPGGPGFPGFGGKAFGRLGGIVLDPVAKALGISTDELKSDLAKGQSIADIAKAKNVDLNKIIDALVADANAKIDQAVKDGHLPQAMADSLKAKLKQSITDAVNGKLPTGPMGGFPGPGGPGGPGGFRGHGRFGGPGGSGSSGTTTPTTTKPATS
jgi:hypothetical protein